MGDRLKFRMFHSKTMHYRQDLVLECLCQQINFDTNSDIGICYDHIGEHDAKFMQYTGFKDKKDEDLYEFDIVQDGFKRLFIIEPCQGGFHLQEIKLFKDGGYTKTNCYTSSMYSKDYFVIIGNIYENPELLEGSK